MKRKLFFLTIMAGAILCAKAVSIEKSDKLPSPFCIIPQPQSVKMLKDAGLSGDGLTSLKVTGDLIRPVMGEKLNHLPYSGRTGKGVLSLRLDISENIPASEEGYVMTISGGGVEIVSRGEAGLFYGCQSLEQLLEDADQYKKAIPACVITDSPALKYRAVHFDVKHHLDNMNYYYKSIDRLARYKINAVIFEFEDKLRYRRQPLVGAPQAMSIDEMAALTRYARARHIEISPLIQGLGHATFILKHQEYAHLREVDWNRWAFCPLHEGTYQVLFDLYRDAIDATPGSKYLHIGGDEIGNIGLCPRCKPTADKDGMLALNLYWLKRVCEFAKENGRIPIFWDDMPLKYAGVHESTHSYKITQEQADKTWKENSSKLDKLLEDFPKNCIYMRWQYTLAREPGNIMAIDWYKIRGLKVFGATAAQTHRTMLFPFDDREKGLDIGGLHAIKSFMQLASEKQIDGMLCTAWDDVSPHMETSWRGFIAAAEYSWSTGGRTLEEYDSAWLQKEFGIAYPGFYSLYRQLLDGSNFWYKAFFRKGLNIDSDNFLQPLVQLAHWMPPTAGEENKKIDYTSRLLTLPDKNAPGKWSTQYADRLKEAADQLAAYPKLESEIRKFYESSIRNRYHWELYNAINNFMITAPRMLIALKQSDTEDKLLREKGIENVRKELDIFNTAWKNLLEVYGKTRFTSNPPDYVSDRYFHFASQKEDLSYMIQADDMFHGMIKKWMNDL